jgi:hypothetical protein
VRRRVAICTIAVALVATCASAQVAGPGNRPARWEIGGGVGWSDGFTGPTATAELTANGESSGGFDLFSSESELKNGAGFAASVAFHVSPTMAIEAGLRYSQPTLSYHLANDVENAAPVTAQENLNRYIFTGALVWHVRPITSASRLVPFVAGGGGYVRDLHEGNELIETGGEIHAVGGVKYWLGAGRRRFGLRGEAGFSVISGGFDFRDSSRTVPIASAGLLYLF